MHPPVRKLTFFRNRALAAFKGNFIRNSGFKFFEDKAFEP